MLVHDDENRNLDQTCFCVRGTANRIKCCLEKYFPERDSLNTLRSDKLIWSDEFDHPRQAHRQIRSGGSTKQVIMDGGLGNFSAIRGNLIIRAMKTRDGFTSARLVSKGLVQFKYGRLECRLQLPKGRGLWSAIWMLGAHIDDATWPACGEIDVVENLGAEPNRAFGTIRCPGHFGDGGISGDYICSEELADNFRVFAVEWLPDRISWRVDEAEYFSVSRSHLGSSWVFDHAFFILINLAVGGSLGGVVADLSAFPAELRIDYIRVYKIG
jgi:hypothetical protein